MVDFIELRKRTLELEPLAQRLTTVIEEAGDGNGLYVRIDTDFLKRVILKCLKEEPCPTKTS